MRNAVILGGLLVLAGVIGSCYMRTVKAGEKPPATDDARTLAEQAMEPLRQDDVTGMMEALRGQLIKQLPDFDRTLEMCATHRRLHSDLHGKTLKEVELVRKEVVGQSFARFTYIERCERHAIVWRLGYYRGADGWKLNEFEWDDKPKALYSAVR